MLNYFIITNSWNLICNVNYLNYNSITHLHLYKNIIYNIYFL